MARDLAGEDRVFLPHPLLDERVADAVDQRDAAGALDRLPDRPARADVVDDLRARVLLEHRLGEQGGDEVARDELAGVVDEEAAVRVAVERRAELGLVLEHLADHELAVLREEGVRRVVREGAVGLEEVRHGVDRDPLQHRRQHHAGHPVRRVDHHAPTLDLVQLDEGQDLVHEARKDIPRRGPSPRDRSGPDGTGHGPIADVQKAGVAADGHRAPADDLHAVVLLGIVRGGHLDPAVELEVADREVEHLGADEPDVDDVRPCVSRPLDHGVRHRGRGDAHVPPDRDLLRLELLDVGATDRVATLLVQLRRVDPTDVVRLEDFRVEHHRDAKRRLVRSYT